MSTIFIKVAEHHIKRLTKSMRNTDEVNNVGETDWIINQVAVFKARERAYSHRRSKYLNFFADVLFSISNFTELIYEVAEHHAKLFEVTHANIESSRKDSLNPFESILTILAKQPKIDSQIAGRSFFSNQGSREGTQTNWSTYYDQVPTWRCCREAKDEDTTLL